MSPLEAARRLFINTPRERIHTHQWEPMGVAQQGMHRSPKEKRYLRAELLRMRAEGKTIIQMREALQVCHRTIVRLIGPAPKERRK